MLLKQLINIGIATISRLYPERESREMVLVFLEHQIGTGKHTHILDPGYEVSVEVASAAVAAFDRMAGGEPLQYVTGKAFFYGRQFRVTPATLIPRPETELLCRLAVDASSKPAPRILDLCTGSGCIAWTLALELPGARVTATDLSEEALKVAASQDFPEETAGTGALPPVFVKSDVLDRSNISAFKGSYDLIVSNPPYVMHSEKALMRQNVLEHEPHMALFVPDQDPLVFYEAVADWSSELLSPDGIGIVEINEALGEETAEVFRLAGFVRAEVIKDLNDRDRFVRFSWK